MTESKICIRNLDPDLYQRAQVAAAKASKPGRKVSIGKWMNQAIREKLERDK